MLATTIGVDRSIERDVWRLVSGNNAFGMLYLHLGFQLLLCGFNVPAIIKSFIFEALKPSAGIAERATPSLGIQLDTNPVAIKAYDLSSVFHVLKVIQK